MRGLLFSVTKWCLTFCSRADCSTPGLPVPHYLPEFAQVHVHVELSPWKRPWCCKDWRQKEKRVAENEMRWLDGIPAQWTTRGYSPVKIKDKSSEKTSDPWTEDPACEWGETQVKAREASSAAVSAPAQVGAGGCRTPGGVTPRSGSTPWCLSVGQKEIYAADEDSVNGLTGRNIKHQARK